MIKNKEKCMEVDRPHDAGSLSPVELGQLLTSNSALRLEVPDEKLLSIVASGIDDDPNGRGLKPVRSK